MQKKFDKVKMHGLSWVIVLKFENIDAAKDFAEREGFGVKIAAGTATLVIRIED